jgi:hypothetical protein
LKEAFAPRRMLYSMKSYSSVSLIIVASACLASLKAKELPYETPVTLHGKVTILYDMSYVDSDVGPMKNPSGVKIKFPDPSKADLQKPVRHLILN